MRDRTRQVLDLARSQIVRPRDITALELPRRILGELVESGELVRTARGLYVAADFDLTQNHPLAETAKRWPHAVVCLLSALQFHELTLELPSEVWIAVRRGTAVPRSKDLRPRVLQISEDSFQEGIETHILEGVEVKIYSTAKTVADCFKFRSLVGTPVAYEALKNAWSKRKASSKDLVYFAKLCRVYNVMRPYFETLS